MKHISKENWQRYVKDELKDEALRENYEAHLYDCEKCMETYLQVIDAVESSLPDIDEGSSFTDNVMAKINGDKPKQKTIRKRPFYQRTMFHYVVAATITIVLMSSGVFQSITHYIEDVQKTTFSEQTPSITNQLLEKTFIRTNNDYEGGD